MLAKLKDKPGGQEIPAAVGDFADVAIEGLYSLVFAAASTFFGAVTQEDQVRCFVNVEGHLLCGGRFVIEAFVPDLTRFDPGRFSVREVAMDRVRVDASRHHPVTQTIDGQAIELGEQGTRLVPFRMRYAWPSELDLMARLAGLTLSERWGGWNKAPFAHTSTQHVSIYERRSDAAGQTAV